MKRFKLFELPGTSQLYGDYMRREDKAVSLFGRNPYETASIKAQASALADRDYDREQLSAILEEQNRALDADEAALGNCRRLRRPNCLAVVTGQQVGLLGGPLYTALKALHTVRLAEFYERELGQPVVPIFWMELEDHDLDEVSRITVKDDEHRLHTLQLNTAGASSPSRKPVKDILLGEDIERLKSDLEEIWPATEHSREIWGLLKASHTPDRTFSEAFGLFQARLLSRFGLILADPSHPAFKRRAAEIFAMEVDGPLTDLDSYAAHRGLILDAGYHLQVETRKGHLQLYLLEGGEKRRMVRSGGRFKLSGSDTKLSREDIEAVLKKEPGRLIPSVLLRPLVQDTLFPTLAYVGGPAEVAYWAQLTPLYEAAGIPMPAVVPRTGASMMGSASRRYIRKFEIELEQGEIFQAKDALVGHILSEHIPSHSKHVFRWARREILEALGRLHDELETGDKGFAKATEAAQQKIEYHLEKLEGKYKRAMERRHEVVVRQIERLSNTLFPLGLLQERVFPQAQFVNLYGSAAYDLIAEALNPANPDHCFIEV